MTGKCKKHRRKGTYRWRICSHGPWEWVCDQCDLELNKLALKWRFPKTWRKRYERYRKKIESRT